MLYRDYDTVCSIIQQHYAVLLTTAPFAFETSLPLALVNFEARSRTGTGRAPQIYMYPYMLYASDFRPPRYFIYAPITTPIALAFNFQNYSIVNFI